MFRKVLPAVFGLALSLAFGTTARAQFGAPDFYIAAGAGGAILEDTSITDVTTATSFDTVPFPGYALTGALGLDFGILRLEGELFYNEYNLNTIGLAGIDADAEGAFKTLAGMGNLFIDLPLAVVTPFIGGGVGYAEVKADNFSFAGSPVSPLVDDKDTGLAWQLRAGIAFAILPLTDMTIGYRYFVTDDLEMSNALGDIEIEKLKSHIFELGLRVTF
jgi:opacity protein-like surface antigen